MLYPAPHYSSALEQAVDRYPVTVTPDTSVAEAIALISQLQNHCPFPQDLRLEPDRSDSRTLIQPTGIRANCILVVDKPTPLCTEFVAQPPEQSTLLGIFTPRNLLQLIATGILDHPEEATLDHIRIGEVMSIPICQLTESEDQDIFTALSMFRQHQILHLPVVNSQGHLVGVVTPARIRQVLQPSNILRTRRVADEIITDVLTAPVNTSVLTLAQMMATHPIGCVVIHNQLATHKLEPVGIVTAEDIVLAQFLQLNLAETTAATIMGIPQFSLKVQDSLWLAHQEMQARQLQRLLVSNNQGQLQGIITQMSLLRMLDPTEMYRVIRQLKQSVYKLQAEKMELLRSRNIKLEKQVQERTAQLHEQLQRERLLAKISLQIHQSLNLDEILNTTVAELRDFLSSDRVVIYQILNSGVGELVAESVGEGWRSLSENRLNESVINYYKYTFFDQNIYIVEDIEKARLSKEKLQILSDKKILAYLVVPIIQDGQLWGTIEVHHCQKSRHWLPSETNLLQQLATQLAIAIYQAQLYQQVQALNTDLEKQVLDRTAELQRKVQELQQLNILKDEFLSTVPHELRTPLSNMKMAIYMLKLAPTAQRQKVYFDILENECARETNLINDLLNLQKLEAENIPISLDLLNLVNWIPRITQPFYSRANSRKLVLNVELPPDLPSVRTNTSSLERIIAELLNNACKYTIEGGEINLKLETLPIKSDLQVSHKLRLQIANQAQIPEQELPRIFDKFYRVQNADPWKQGGTGLGLALVEKLIEQLDGKIEVTSQNGWTTFTIDFPI
ncbi:CBS domain-containing protein [Limnospira indica]|uniref:histidine kinase n=1 Tax=Limnospira indica PCC 8005 TaxID=376219 RepID=A0A9P1P1N4_9CYAN|nr:CBS domain-containing protein [Limnospira indica]CDM98146.1 Signal transduction histidine kinase [Limnospira indica PCC 8005]